MPPAKMKVKLTTVIRYWLRPCPGFVTVLLLVFMSLVMAQASEAESSGVEVLAVPRSSGADIEAQGYQTGTQNESRRSIFFNKGRYSSTLVGRYLDLGAAQRLVKRFQEQGLTAFVLEKKLEEQRLLLPDEPVGDFFLVMVGLFGLTEEAENLGQRLLSQGQITGYQVLSVETDAELESIASQNRALDVKAVEVSRKARTRASRPLGPGSPVVTGEAFKKHVYGRYVASYRDSARAQLEAERLTAGGWPASVKAESGASMWYRVYLVPAEDSWNWESNEATLKAGLRSAASQPGIIILADMSGLRGKITAVAPKDDRDDASACAGFSEAGRLGTVLSRTIAYIPETSYTAALVPVNPYHGEEWWKVVDRVEAWWSGKARIPETVAVYGPTIFDRPAMEGAVARLEATEERASLALGLASVYYDLSNIPGRKVLVVFSEFLGLDKPEDVRAMVGRLKSAIGNLDIVFVYGDTGGYGHDLAQELAKEFGSGKAWDSCRLITNNAYFEQYVKDIFR